MLATMSECWSPPSYGGDEVVHGRRRCWGRRRQLGGDSVVQGLDGSGVVACSPPGQVLEHRASKQGPAVLL